ncbi:MAG: hypothetical protein JWQ76_4537 [Ramlibacter sp.]|nr:hypothetical protein [Ramlibacter sp.]
MLLFVYRLRYRGERMGRIAMANEGIPGDLRLEPYESGRHGRPVNVAKLFRSGTREELIPSLDRARIVRVREALLVVGIEQVPRGRKGVEQFRQAWVCAVQEIALQRWPELRQLPRTTSSTGFDPADDDCGT